VQDAPQVGVVAPRAPTRDKRQLDLWQAELDGLPWQGQSPRALTKVGLSLFSRREPQKDDRFFVDPNQIDLFRAAKRKAPREFSRGAPLLLPFDGG